MTQEEKQLLLKDLCARLPYGVKVKISDDLLLDSEKGTIDGKKTMNDDKFTIKCDKYSWIIPCNDCKPYLRPMSSMTEEELAECEFPLDMDYNGYCIPSYPALDWLNAHHFDYRGLIEKGLALEAPKGMYKTE